MVVVQPPTLDHSAGLGKGSEYLLVQAFVAQAAVEAFDETILLWLAEAIEGRDKRRIRPSKLILDS